MVIYVMGAVKILQDISSQQSLSGTLA